MDIKGRVGGAGNTRAGEAGREIIEMRPPASSSSTIALDHTTEQMTTKYYAAMTARISLCIILSLCGLIQATARAT